MIVIDIWMITKSDISRFFDQEAEAEKKHWEATMSLPLKERIRKRRAIKDVYIDKSYRETSSEHHPLLKLRMSVNLSDFKEGDSLLLHKDDSATGIKCTLYSFNGDDEIIVDVYPALPSNLENYLDTPLVLDKNLVDLRQYVYNPFLYELPTSQAFWQNHLINTCPKPSFENREECKADLDGFLEYLNSKLLPSQYTAAVNSISAKDYYLIQGPPGTGKSFVLGWIILEELLLFKHKVIVIGPNHMAINNTLVQVFKMVPKLTNLILKVGQPYNAPDIETEQEGEKYTIRNFWGVDGYDASNQDGGWVIGITPHALHSSRGDGLKCDTLVIDEAGQMTIPLAMMGMIRAKKVILAGDHKQLPPIIASEEIDDEMKRSIFQVLMTDENCTMLDVSFRMCEPICKFVSDLFYDGKLKSNKPGFGDRIICKDPLYSFSAPIVIHHVDDNGEQTSDKEAEFIANTINNFIKLGLPADEVAVLSPFRAQAAAIRRHIRKQKEIDEDTRKLIVSDTIDKMQGQEREVIIYSMVSGNFEYMTEMAEFLYNPRKINVAFSRAKYKLIIVGNLDKLKRLPGIEYEHIHKMLQSELAVFI